MTDMQIFADTKEESAEIEQIRNMKMSEFSKAETWVKIESDLLPSLEYGEIYIASNEKAARGLKGVIYGPGELARILALNLHKEGILGIHQAKAILKGRVVETKPKEADK